MKVRIQKDKCVGHGMCKLAAPKVFALSDEDGHGYVRTKSIPEDQVEAVENAERGCPEGAIYIDRGSSAQESQRNQK